MILNIYGERMMHAVDQCPINYNDNRLIMGIILFYPISFLLAYYRIVPYFFYPNFLNYKIEWIYYNLEVISIAAKAFLENTILHQLTYLNFLDILLLANASQCFHFDV